MTTNTTTNQSALQLEVAFKIPAGKSVGIFLTQDEADRPQFEALTVNLTDDAPTVDRYLLAFETPAPVTMALATAIGELIAPDKRDGWLEWLAGVGLDEADVATLRAEWSPAWSPTGCDGGGCCGGACQSNG